MCTGNSIKINIRLTPKAARNALLGWAEDVDDNDILKVSITAVPERGKANKALINFLAKEWHIPKGSISLTKGKTNRNKTLLIKDISEKQQKIILSKK